MATIEMEEILNLVPGLMKVPYSKIWTTYDEDANVLYVNFKKPSHADDSQLTDDDVIIRYEKGKRDKCYALLTINKKKCCPNATL